MYKPSPTLARRRTPRRTGPKDPIMAEPEQPTKGRPEQHQRNATRPPPRPHKRTARQPHDEVKNGIDFWHAVEFSRIKRAPTSGLPAITWGNSPNLPGSFRRCQLRRRPVLRRRPAQRGDRGTTVAGSRSAFEPAAGRPRRTCRPVPVGPLVEAGRARGRGGCNGGPTPAVPEHPPKSSSM